MLVEQILETYSKNDPRLLRMAFAVRSAKRMGICFIASCIAALYFSSSPDTAMRLLFTGCIVGDLWYAKSGWSYYQAYSDLRKEGRLEQEILRKLGFDWGVRFIIPLSLSIVLGSVLAVLMRN